MRTLFGIVQSLAPVFVGCVAGFYLYQALNGPQPWFTRRECWVIGVGLFAFGFLLALAYHFAWFDKLDAWHHAQTAPTKK